MPLCLWPVESCRPWRTSAQVSSTNLAFAICPGISNLVFTCCRLSIGSYAMRILCYSWLPEVSSTNLAFAMCPSFSCLCPGLSFKLQPGQCLLPFALTLVVAPTWPLPFALRSLACSQSQVSSSNLAFACCPLLLRWWPVESCRPWRSSDQVSSTNPAFAICPGSSKLIFTRCDLSIGLHLTAHFLFRLAA